MSLPFWNPSRDGQIVNPKDGTKTAQFFQWLNALYSYLNGNLGSGYSGTVTLIKLTPTGANGHITFLNQQKEIALRLPQVIMPTEHFLLEGMYARQIRIPAHTAFVGRRHKKMHYFMCLAGGAWVCGDSDKPINIHSGMLLMCRPGSQRIGVTYADTIFVTVHRTEEDQLQNIEDDCVEFDSTNQYGVGNLPLNRLEEL